MTKERTKNQRPKRRGSKYKESPFKFTKKKLPKHLKATMTTVFREWGKR